jgi:hypothetical protein
MRPAPRARNNVIRATPRRFAACVPESKLECLFVSCMILMHHKRYAISGANGEYGKVIVIDVSHWDETGVLLPTLDYFGKLHDHESCKTRRSKCM